MTFNPVVVICKPHTMSGQRGGVRRALDKKTAEEWIARGWAVRADEQKDRPKPLIQSK